MRAKVTPDGRLRLPAARLRRHALTQGGELFIEDIGDSIVLRTLDQVVSRAQALSRKLVADNTHASVEDFLADRTK
jgi:bifunctional DNA-binding transcriptional regulator/antitoxin component of YhaV-PrlF toxin-antitoxin module